MRTAPRPSACTAPPAAGRSTVLNDVRERVTAMPDAILVQVNGANVGDELTWEPLAAATACGPAASDEDDAADKILAVLEWAQLLVTERSARWPRPGIGVPADPGRPRRRPHDRRGGRGGRRFPAPGPILEFLASKQRKSAVCLILARQRATQKQTGGGRVHANLSQVVIGNTNRATESRHATGAEARDPRHQRVLPRPDGLLPGVGPPGQGDHRPRAHVPARRPPGRARLLQAHRGHPQGHQAPAARRGTCLARPSGARSCSGSPGRE